MRGIAPVVTSILIVTVTLVVSSILATFVLGYANRQMTYSDMCITGTLVFVNNYPKINGTLVVSVVEAGGVELDGFTIEAIDANGDVWVRDVNATIKPRISGTVSADFSNANLKVGNNIRVSAVNCPTARTEWTALRS